MALAAHAYLKPGGWLLVEHGHEQAEAVARLLKAGGFARIELYRDMAGLPRVALAGGFSGPA